ncbi:MAG: hypothetical protein SH821_13785 [Phototrophicales bacterium]|nr:hypothetical protein [Phototrophicales bacterium]
MAKDDIKKLRSKDAEERKSAIRGVAKSLDRSALHQLAVMSGDDPDPDIRKIAQQAGVYIRQKTGDIEAPPPSADKKPEKPKRVSVDPESAEKAQKLMEFASYQSDGGDKVKAMKALVKAAVLDPNLRDDSFYLSLSESLTNLEGQDAIKALNDDSRMEQTAKKDVLVKLDKEVKAHEDELNTITRRDVIFDMALLAGMSIMAIIVLLFLMVYQAGQYDANFKANRELLVVAFSEENTPRIQWVDNTVGISDFSFSPQNVLVIFETIPQPPPATPAVKVEVMKPTELFEKTTIPYWSELGIGNVLGRGIGLGILLVITSLALVGVVHLFASTFFGGNGRFAYTAHRLLSLFMGRTILFAIIGIAGVLLYFSSGGADNIALILMVIIGIFAFFTLLTSATTIKKAYRFGIFSGLLVMILGLLVAIILGGIGGFVLTQVI